MEGFRGDGVDLEGECDGFGGFVELALGENPLGRVDAVVLLAEEVGNVLVGVVFAVGQVEREHVGAFEDLFGDGSQGATFPELEFSSGAAAR